MFTVTTTADAGPGSLRQAILDANALPGEDRIAFAIDQGVQTIRPLSSLPLVADGTFLDGATQPGYQGTPLIELDGSNAGTQVSGLTLQNSTVRGLAINRFDFHGVVASSGARVVGNFIGTDVTGTQTRPNRVVGVNAGFDSIIGGPSPEDRNIISGNPIGVQLGNRSVIQGNYIGTDVTGTLPLGNTNSGVRTIPAAGSSNDNLIGGAKPGEGNLISGNAIGISFTSIDRPHLRNRVQGNLIGTDHTGTKPLGNLGSGVAMNSSFDSLIGGLEPGAGNVVAYNGGAGIGGGHSAGTTDVLGNVVYGNAQEGVRLHVINSRVQGNWVVGNGGDGLRLTNPRGGDLVGGDGLGNFIAYNGGAGIVVDGSAPNSLRGNSIVGNAGPGIELRNGGNNDQPAPKVTAYLFAGALHVDSDGLVSPPSQGNDLEFFLEFFASPTCDDSGAGEGELVLGAHQARTDVTGKMRFTARFDAPPVPAGWVVTATATDTLGNTSAFSACAIVHGDFGGAPGGALGDVLAAILAGDGRIGKKTASVSPLG